MPNKPPKIKAGIIYQCNEIWGQGTNYLWINAFANLQKHLPNFVILKCYITCRYGNMCSFGNEPNVLFCTKGIEFTAKNDLCNWFNSLENNTEIKNAPASVSILAKITFSKALIIILIRA